MVTLTQKSSLGWMLGLALSAISAMPVQAAEEPQVSPLAVGENMDIAMDYILTVDGKVVDATEGAEAFHYIHGQGQILESLEEQLIGLHVGDSKEVTLTSEQGYGVVDPEAFVEIPKDRLPADVKPEAGMILQGANPETGKSFRARIHELKDETVVLDLNHPLAGKSLNFKITIKEIAPATPATPAAAQDAEQPT